MASDQSTVNNPYSIVEAAHSKIYQQENYSTKKSMTEQVHLR